MTAVPGTPIPGTQQFRGHQFPIPGTPIPGTPIPGTQYLILLFIRQPAGLPQRFAQRNSGRSSEVEGADYGAERDA